jgi:tetratricopeptide (TPR) repeat protein
VCVSRIYPSKRKKFIWHWKIKKRNYESFLIGKTETVLSSPTSRAVIFAWCLLAGCSSEVLEKQAEQLRQQEKEIARQRKEIDDLLAGQKLQDQKSKDCNRAFREYFEKAQASSDREQAMALYREGLVLCPDDDVAHYELGKIMVDRGLYPEAEKEFEAALKINPDFVDAKKQLDAVRKTR